MSHKVNKQTLLCYIFGVTEDKFCLQASGEITVFIWLTFGNKDW